MPSNKEALANRYDEWVMRMQENDTQALDEFVAEHGEILRRFFLWNGADPADAEELAVDCLGDTVLALARFTPRGQHTFLRWCMAIARNRMVDWYRQRKKRKEQTLGANDADIAVPSNAKPLDGGSGVDEAVRWGLQQLSEADRQILTLRHLQHVGTFTEIGEELGIKKEAARTRYCRAAKRLAKLLAPVPRIQTWLEEAATRDTDVTLAEDEVEEL